MVSFITALAPSGRYKPDVVYSYAAYFTGGV
jgi:hypothetical protein